MPETRSGVVENPCVNVVCVDSADLAWRLPLKSESSNSARLRARLPDRNSIARSNTCTSQCCVEQDWVTPVSSPLSEARSVASSIANYDLHRWKLLDAWPVHALHEHLRRTVQLLALLVGRMLGILRRKHQCETTGT